MKSEMRRQMANMVARAREIGAVQRAWRRLNPGADVHVLFVHTEQWQRPRTRKRHVLAAVLRFSNPHEKVKACLLPASDSRKGALPKAERITHWHERAGKH